MLKWHKMNRTKCVLKWYSFYENIRPKCCLFCSVPFFTFTTEWNTVTSRNIKTTGFTSIHFTVHKSQGKRGFELDRLQRRAPRLMRLRMKLINTNKMLLIACNELVGFVATSIHLCQLQFVQTSQGRQGKHICPRYSRPRENTLGITSSYLPASFLL